MTNFIYLLFALPLLVLARIEEDVMPEVLQDCYSRYPITAANRHHVQTSCLNNYLLNLFGNNTYHGLDGDTLQWLDSLGRKIHIRLKRQTKLRVRKEIRALTETERVNFFDAVNALKQDKIPSFPHNKYDAIAVLHQDDALPSAHNGYNFPSWHRYYLVLFEEALRTKKSGVALPYWDSRIDFRMGNPADTILLSEIFFGNGRGVVYTGPFALWRTPSANSYLRRDIPGPQSSLIDPKKIQSVLNKKYHREILSPTSATDEDNLERHHDGVHRWVGGRDGHMGGLDTSPMDPIFFLHHCFVDYLWERFRERQISLGINPEKDYPPTTDPNHQPNNIMANLKPPKKNIDGYSNSFTRDIYKYAAAPTCDNKCAGASRAFIYCDNTQKGCVSRTRKQFIDDDDFKSIKSMYGKQGKVTIEEARTKLQASRASPFGSPAPQLTLSFDPQRNDDITAAETAPPIARRFAASIVDPRTTSRKRRSVDIDGNKINIDLNINLHLKHELQNFSSSRFDQSNFNNMGIAPIIISNVHQRNTYVLPLQNPKTFNITLQTDGFTYKGRHVGNVIVDERSVSSDIVAFIGFEKPVSSAESKAYVTVYDSYGGVCKPSCLVSRSTYKECSGVIKITDEIPLMYMDSTKEDLGAEIGPFLRFSCVN